MICPICSEPTEQMYKPFCSKKCADIDLGRWMSGSYALPDAQDDEEERPNLPSEPPSGETH